MNDSGGVGQPPVLGLELISSSHIGQSWVRQTPHTTLNFFGGILLFPLQTASSGEVTAPGQGGQGRGHSWALQGYSRCRSYCCCCGSGTQHRGFHSCRTPGSGAPSWGWPTSQPPCRAPCRAATTITPFLLLKTLTEVTTTCHFHRRAEELEWVQASWFKAGPCWVSVRLQHRLQPRWPLWQTKNNSPPFLFNLPRSSQPTFTASESTPYPEASQCGHNKDIQTYSIPSWRGKASTVKNTAF